MCTLKLLFFLVLDFVVKGHNLVKKKTELPAFLVYVTILMTIGKL